MRLATYNVEWFANLFDDEDQLLADGGWSGRHDVTRQDQAEAIAVIALGAKMAKADGMVTRDEISAFRERVHIPPSEVPQVGRFWDLARQTKGMIRGATSPRRATGTNRPGSTVSSTSTSTSTRPKITSAFPSRRWS